jgi:hypothetical protein
LLDMCLLMCQLLRFQKVLHKCWLRH